MYKSINRKNFFRVKLNNFVVRNLCDNRIETIHTVYGKCIKCFTEFSDNTEFLNQDIKEEDTYDEIELDEESL